MAGASARRTYERRSQRNQEAVARRRPRIYLIGAAIIVIGAVLLGVRGTWPFLGGALIFFGTVWTIAALVIEPNHVRSWWLGAIGEEHVGAILDSLTAEGYQVLHDRRRPGARENIDHVVIGPTGAFVVETKHYRGRVEHRGGELFVNGRRKSAFIDQVERQVSAVQTVLEIDGVTGLICMVGAEISRSGVPAIRGIRVLPPAALLTVIRSQPATWSTEDVDRLAGVARQRLRNADGRAV